MAVVEVHQDNASESISIIDIVHKKIHEGLHFTANHNTTVGTGTAVTVLISTPIDIHVVPSVQADKAVTWTFSESPDASGGTSIIAYNNDRNSSITSQTVLTHTVTYVSSGTILETLFVAVSGAVNEPGIIRNEYILNPSNLYLVKVAAAAAATNVSVSLYMYKEE